MKQLLFILLIIAVNPSFADCLKGESKCGVDGKTYSCTINSSNTSVWKKIDKISKNCVPHSYTFHSDTEVNESCTVGDKKCNVQGMIYECIEGQTWLASQEQCLSSALEYMFSLAPRPDKILAIGKAFIEHGQYDKAEQAYLSGLADPKKPLFAKTSILESLADLHYAQHNDYKAKGYLYKVLAINEKSLEDDVMDIPLDFDSITVSDPELNETESVHTISQADEIDKIQSLVKSLTEQMNTIREDYKNQLLSAGFDDVLNLYKLKNDQSLNKSLNATRQGKTITQNFKALNKQKIDDALIYFKNLDINEKLKQRVGNELAYAAKQWQIRLDETWNDETDTLNEYEKTLQLFLDNKSHYQFNNHKLTFDNDKYLDALNNHINNINALKRNC